MNELVVRAPLDKAWTGDDPFEAARALAEGAAAPELVRDIEGRRTLRFQLAGGGHYLKLQRGVSWGRIAGEVARLRWPILGAGNEWRAIEQCHALGVPTMRAVAYGERGRSPAHRESFLVTEAIEPAVDLDTFTRNWRHESPPVALKRAMLREVARIARRMHEGGMNHRDFYICHFLLHLDPTPTPKALRLSLIDLHRAQVRARTPRRWRDKDLAALYFSALDIGLTMRDKLRFLREYFPTPLRDTLRRERPLLDHIEREAARLKLRYQHKFADRPALQR